LVAADDLPDKLRRVLRPGESVKDGAGIRHGLPTSFFRIDSWEQAREMQLTPHFCLWELIGVDVREDAEVRGFPRYVPCAVLHLASALELLRLEAGTYVHI